MELKIFELALKDTKIERRNIPKLRGYIASKFPHYIDLHNHIDDNKFQYKYPLIQYKTIGGTPYIIGINEGADLLVKIEDEIQDICMEETTIRGYEKIYKYRRERLQQIDDMKIYKFITPWMALNQQNYKEYKEKDSLKEKNKILEKVLKGNILSLCKSFNYRILKPLEVTMIVEPIAVKFKNKSMIAFKGNVMMNMDIPDYLGIGKSVSRGFGTIKRSG